VILPGAIVAANGPGVEFSLDNGQTFQLGTIAGTNTPLTGAATDVVADPNNSQRFYAAVAYSKNLAVTNYPGVYRSDNCGLTWTEIDNGQLNLSNPNWIKLAVHNQNGKTVLYAGVVGSDGNVSGVYRSVISSSGSASQWTQIGALGLANIPTSFFHFALTADPIDANVVYLSAYAPSTAPFQNIYRGDASANGGLGGWSNLYNASSAPHSDSRSLTFLGSFVLLESDDGGVFGLPFAKDVSFTNGSPPWYALSANMRATEFFSVTMDPTTGLIAGGTQDNGTPVQTSVGGTTWNQQFRNDGGLTQYASDGTLYYFNDRQFLRGSNAQVLMAASTSPGTAYSGLNTTDQNNVQGFADVSFVYALNPANANRLLVGLTGLYESTNQGDILRTVTPTGLSGNVSAITYGVNNANAAYVGTDSAQLWVGTSAGGTWTWQQITGNWPSTARAVRIVVDPNDYRIAYVLDKNGKVWRTTDAGQTSSNWTDLTDDLDSLAPAANLVQLTDNTGINYGQSPIQTIELYDPTPGSQPGDGVLLAAGLGGVFSLRLGSNDPCWHQLGTGLPNAVVTDLHYSQQKDVLLAGTYGRGAWTISTASGYLNEQSNLEVFVDRQAANNVVDIRPDPSNGSFLQVIEDGVVEYDRPYSYINQVAVYANNPGDTIRLEDLPACLPFLTNTGPNQSHGNNFIESDTSNFPSLITVASSGATDTIHIGDASHQLFGVNSNLNIQGNGIANVIVDDSGNQNFPFALPPTFALANYQLDSTQYAINGGQLTRAAAFHRASGPTSYPPTFNFSATINYSRLANLTVESGSVGPYTYQVNNTGGATSVSIQAGSPSDTVTVGDNSDNLAYIVGTLNVQGNGNTKVLVDDSGNKVPVVYPGLIPFLPSTYVTDSTQYTINTDQLTRTAHLFQASGPPFDPPTLTFPATINYSNLSSLMVTSGPSDGPYTYQVNSTVGANSVTIKAGSSSDAVTVGDKSHNLAYLGTLNVQGNSNTIVAVDDSGNQLLPYYSSTYLPILTQYTIGGGQLTRTATLIQGAGPSTDPPFLTLSGMIKYSGLNEFNVTGGPLGSYLYQVADTTGMHTLLLQGGSGPSTFDVQGASAGTYTYVTTGTPQDQINVGSAANTLEPILGLVSVFGQGGNTTLNIYDQGNTGPQRYEYDVYAFRVLRTPAIPGQPLGSPTQTIYYSGIANVNVHGSSNNTGSGDLFGVLSTPLGTAVALYAGSGGGNEFVVGSSVPPYLDGIQGPLALHGASIYDFVVDYDYTNPSPHTYTLSTPNPTTTLLQRDGMAGITHDGMGGLILYVPVVGGNHINVQGIPAHFFANLTTRNGDQDVVGSLAPTSQGGTMNAIQGGGLHLRGAKCDRAGHLDRGRLGR
jgi:photosystem II stability/assembly factor-like uncharacterized protein